MRYASLQLRDRDAAEDAAQETLAGALQARERFSGASSVRTWLTGRGIDAARLTAKGFGKSQPVADNGTGEGRAKNRRVELVQLQCAAK